jgi:SagB-type dehydrogenase family enzyme
MNPASSTRMEPDTALSDRYWARTLYDVAAWPGEPAAAERVSPPLPLKLYEAAPRHPLPVSIAPILGDVRRLSPSFPGAPRHTPPLDAARLATLLHYSYGYGRLAVSAEGGVWPHRLVPSAGRAYPTELYVWLPGGTGLPAGVHYYDPAHHSLVTVRRDADRRAVDEVLAPALGTDLTGVTCVVVVTMHFWRVAHRYGEYGYRLSTQEAGMVTGNVLAVATAMGWRGHLHHQFLDLPLARWLGLEPDEEAVAVAIPLYRWDDQQAHPATREARSGVSSADLLARIAPVDLTYRKPSALDRQRCASFLELDAASRFADTAQFRPPHGTSVPNLGSAFTLPPDQAEPVVDLAAAMRARCSGPVWFNPTGEPVGADTLWRICRYVIEAYPSDVCIPGSAMVGLLVTSHRVHDLAPGTYLLRGDGDCSRVHTGPVAPRLAATVPANVSPFNFHTVNAVVSVVADPAKAGGWFGERAYRILNVEAGVVAQRVCVLAGGAGLIARPYNSYRAREVARVVGLAGTGLVPLFQIAIGRPRVTPTWQLPLDL